MPAYRSLEDVARGTRERVAQLAEEVGQASRANRALFEQLVAAEVGRVAGRVGLVPQAELRAARDELADLRGEVAYLRQRLDVLEDAGTPTGTSGSAP